MSVNGLGGSAPYPQAGANWGATQRDAHATATAGQFWKDIEGDIGRNPGLRQELRGCQMRLESLAKDFRAGGMDAPSFDAEVKAVMAARHELMFQAFQQHSTALDQRAAASSLSGEDEEGVFPQADGPPLLNEEAKALLSDARGELDAMTDFARHHTLGGPKQEADLKDKLAQAHKLLTALESKHLSGAEVRLDAALDAKGVRVAQAKACQDLRVELHGVTQLLREAQGHAKRFGPGSNMTERR